MTKERLLAQGLPRNDVDRLVKKFNEELIVKDANTGYIETPWVNKIIDPEMLSISARMISELYIKKLDPPPNKIAGIANSGIMLATAIVLIDEDIDLTPSRKLATGIPGSWKGEDVIINNVPSFTTNKATALVFPELHRGDVVLFVDDYCAFAGTSSLIADKCEKKGILPHFAFNVAKHFPTLKPPQIGLQKLKDRGINAFTAITLTDIKQDSVKVISCLDK